MNASALAGLAAALLAVDPEGLQGLRLRARACAQRKEWLAALTALFGAQAPVARVPAHIGDDRLLGGLDLAATLSAGRPVIQRGLLAAADGGIVLLSMAERLEPGVAARIGAVMDEGVVSVARDGFEENVCSSFAVVALDEGLDEQEQPPLALQERLSMAVDASESCHGDSWRIPATPQSIAAARARLAAVHASDEQVQALCAVAMNLGVLSLRAPLAALRVARASAALAGRTAPSDEDLGNAVALVLAPRATRLPQPPAEDEAPAREPETSQQDTRQNDSGDPLEERVLEAATAAIPPSLLEKLRAESARRAPAAAGRSGEISKSFTRGRPVGSRAGRPATGVRLDLLDTLRAAAPWQRLRGRNGTGQRIEVRPSDFRIRRLKHRAESTSVFAVDASGSAALHRLAETKGAVELLLAECYVRRDKVALVAFRGAAAEVLLPPTRSLVRAKRALARLPGGGGTPLAAGIRAAADVADAARRRGESPCVVLMTDGRANVGHDGSPGREQAREDAMNAARALRAQELRTLLLDIAPRPSPAARELASAMGALYMPLPHANASRISDAVRAAGQP